LFLSPGFLALSRIETSEGVHDAKLMVHYFGRFLLINRLLPLLQKAVEQNEPATVVSVLGAGREGTIDFDDYELVNSFGVSAAASHSVTSTSLMVNRLAKQYPKISFVHAYPGFVKTSIFANLPWYARLAVYPILPFCMSPEDCGQNMIYAATNAKYQGGGGYLVNDKGDAISPKGKFVTEENAEKAFELSNKVVGL